MDTGWTLILSNAVDCIGQTISIDRGVQATAVTSS